MPQISLTDFVDIVSRSGTPKATKVAEVKNRPPYEPAFDFYKPLRDRIIDIHEKGKSKSDLAAVMAAVTDPKKITAYPDIIAGYRKWWGNKSLAWFDPPSHLFTQHGVDVSVNPELGLVVNANRHLIKLYFKAEPLTKNRVDIITHMMAVALGLNLKGVTMSVLDVRNSKLISPTVPISHLNAMLDAELAYIAALWRQV
jgi:hypothetical protein